MQNKHPYKRDCQHDVWAVMLQAAHTVYIRRQAKVETALVLYKELDTTLTGRINDTSTLFWIWLSGV